MGEYESDCQMCGKHMNDYGRAITLTHPVSAKFFACTECYDKFEAEAKRRMLSFMHHGAMV